MDSKQNNKQGNDCTIYKTVSLQQLGSKWVVVVLMRCEGYWVDINDLAHSIEKFDTEEEARQYYNNYVF